MRKKKPEPQTQFPLLGVKLYDVEKLRKDPRNSRTHGERNIKAIVASLERFGQRKNIVVDKNGVVIAGNGTLEAASRLGWKQIAGAPAPTKKSDARAFALADNRTAELAEWDSELLRADITGLLASSDYDIEALTSLGFGQSEIAGHLRTEPLGNDQVPEPPKVATTKVGDLWQLGEHRLICGDSTDAEVVGRLMGRNRSILMATDPPYGVAYNDDARVAAERAHGRPQRLPKWEEGIANDEKTNEAIQPFLEACFRTATAKALQLNAAWYLWHAHLTQAFFAAAAAAAANLVLSRQIIWVKPSLLFAFGDYHWRHELCFYGWVQGHRPPFYGERNQTTVWELSHEVSNADRVHPTQKPVEIFAIPIRNHTKTGEVCYEPFSGSGTQTVAAEQLGRRCFSVELDPKYCDVVVERWQALSGKKAKRARQ